MTGKNRVNVPGARAVPDTMMYEIAKEMGGHLKQGCNGDLSSRDACAIGGMTVRKMIEAQERQMNGKR